MASSTAIAYADGFMYLTVILMISVKRQLTGGEREYWPACWLAYVAAGGKELCGGW
jgi:hypothetical protein